MAKKFVNQSSNISIHGILEIAEDGNIIFHDAEDFENAVNAKDLLAELNDVEFDATFKKVDKTL